MNSSNINDFQSPCACPSDNPTENNILDHICDEFPICRQKFPIMGGKEEKKLIYFDHGASTHPPRQVIEAHKTFLENFYANIHRGNHNLSLIASDMFDNVEHIIMNFIGGNPDNNTIILTNNTTGSLDLCAYAMSFTEGITLSTVMEHHSNYLPHLRRGKVELVGINQDGSLNMDDLEDKLNRFPVKLVAVTGASNVTGFMPDIHRIACLAHEKGAKILVDGAQLLAHHPVSMKADDDPEHIDFFAAAGHKAYAPFGSAFLFAPRDIMDQIPPYIPGGGTVEFVTPREITWAKSPDRHQGGTPNIPGAIAMAESLKFLGYIGMDKVREHEKSIYSYAIKKLSSLYDVDLLGPQDPERCIGVISFNIQGLPNELVSAILNYEGAIATRNGCFCAHPYIQALLHIEEPEECKLKVDRGDLLFMPGAVRASLGIYNKKEEIDDLVTMVEMIRDREWKGVYDLAHSTICQPIRFTLRESEPGTAACIREDQNQGAGCSK